MYAHLEIKSARPVDVTGYRLRSKMMFGYGNITIDAECAFPNDAPDGTILLCLYRDDKAAGLPGGELPEEATAEDAELKLLNKILPRSDIVYILSRLGIHGSGDVYENRRRVRIETPRARKHKFYDRFELLLSRGVDENWLRTHGTLFGYNRSNEDRK